MDAINTAIALRQRCLAVHWDRARSKAPLLKGWSECDVMTVEQLRASYHRGYNLAVRLGHWSTPMEGHGLVALDFDIKNPNERCTPYEVLSRYWDGETLEVKSGSGLGHHFYFSCPLDKLPAKGAQFLAKSDKYAHGTNKWEWAIEILSTGRKITCPPSLHPDTGNPYQWFTAIDTPIAVIPESILAAIKEEPKPEQVRGSVSFVSSLYRCAPHSQSPAERFRAMSWRAILEPFGWVIVKKSDNNTLWCRPGKDKAVSASTNADCFYVFTTSTAFQDDRAYTKFQTYSILACGGDMRLAAKRLLSA